MITVTRDDAELLARGIDLDEFYAEQAQVRRVHETSLQMADVLKLDVVMELQLPNGSAAPTRLSLDADTLTVTGEWPETDTDLVIAMTFTRDDTIFTHSESVQLSVDQAEALALPEGVALLTQTPVLDLLTPDIAIAATSASGQPLPAWVDFDADEMVLVLTDVVPAADEGLLRMRVVFTPKMPENLDLPADFHLSADGSYALEFVIDSAVGIDPAINTMLQTQGFFAAQGLFALPQIDPANITASLETLADLPEWLSFDAQTLTFEGLPPVNRPLFAGG